MLVSCQEATNFFAACIAFRNFVISFSVASMQARTCTCICYWEPQALSTIEMHFWWYRKCLYIHACIYNYIEGVKTRKASLRSSEWNNPALFLAASHPRPFLSIPITVGCPFGIARSSIAKVTDGITELSWACPKEVIRIPKCWSFGPISSIHTHTKPRGNRSKPIDVLPSAANVHVAEVTCWNWQQTHHRHQNHQIQNGLAVWAPFQSLLQGHEPIQNP